MLHVEVVATKPDVVLASRISTIGSRIADVMDEFKPDVIALERVFAQANLRTVMGTAQISGVVLYLAAQRGIRVALHTPTEVKAAVTGSGRAAKPQVGAMVARILGLKEAPKPADAADALAIAITHGWKPLNTDASGGVAGATPAQQAWANAERASKAKARR
jgi:crossover junction endodeoxyribonuclease RuvC